jgi:AcrR family transcriptional regulator
VTTDPEPGTAAARRRPELLDLAATMVRDAGTAEAVTMESVALAAGISKPLVYRCFANRDALLIALLEREHDRLHERVRDATDGASSFEEQARGVLDAYLDAVDTAEPSVVDVLTHTVASPEFHERAGQRNVAILATISGMIVDHHHLDEPTSLIAAVMITKGLEGLIELWRGTGAPRDVLADRFIAFSWAGLDGMVAAAG